MSTTSRATCCRPCPMAESTTWTCATDSCWVARASPSSRPAIAATTASCLYVLDPVTRRLASAGPPVPTRSRGFRRSLHVPEPGDRAYFVFIDDSGLARFQQWQLSDDGGQIGAAMVREFEVGSQAEGCAADDELGNLYVAEEDGALWRYSAEPGGGDAAHRDRPRRRAQRHSRRTSRASPSGVEPAGRATSSCRTRAPTTTRSTGAKATTNSSASSTSSPMPRAASMAPAIPTASTSRASRWGRNFRMACWSSRMASTRRRQRTRTSSTCPGRTSKWRSDCLAAEERSAGGGTQIKRRCRLRGWFR